MRNSGCSSFMEFSGSKHLKCKLNKPLVCSSIQEFSTFSVIPDTMKNVHNHYIHTVHESESHRRIIVFVFNDTSVIPPGIRHAHTSCSNHGATSFMMTTMMQTIKSHNTIIPLPGQSSINLQTRLTLRCSGVVTLAPLWRRVIATNTLFLYSANDSGVS